MRGAEPELLEKIALDPLSAPTPVASLRSLRQRGTDSFLVRNGTSELVALTLVSSIENVKQGDRHSVIGIDQVLLPDAHELLQLRLIVLGNTPRIFAGLKLRQG